MRYRFLANYLPVYVVLLLLFLSACSQPQSNEIRFALSSAPISLDPRYATDAASSRINRLLYQRLVDFDERFQPIPSLANWDQLSARQYRFKLIAPQERQFDNGEVLTAMDVKATYDFILEEKNASPHRSSLQNIDSIDIIDDSTLLFHIKQADPLFPVNLGIGIVPASVNEKKINLTRQSIGTGDFRFVAWPSQDQLIIERRSDRQRVRFVHVQDPTVRVLKLIRGEVDMLQNDLPIELVRFLEGKEGISVDHLGGSNFTYLGMNMQDKALSDLRIRQAIAFAIDRESIIKNLFAGETALANAILSPHHWAGLKQTNAYQYQPGQARDLLAAAGYSMQHPLKLQYKTSSDPFRVRIATIIQQQLADVGISVEVISHDWGTFYGDIKAGRFQLYSLSWVGINSPDIFRYVFHSSSLPPQGANRGRYNNAGIDKLIELAELTADVSIRQQYYQQIQQRLLEDLPYVPLWYEAHYVAYNQNISKYSLAINGNYDGLKQIAKTFTHTTNTDTRTMTSWQNF